MGGSALGPQRKWPARQRHDDQQLHACRYPRTHGCRGRRRCTILFQPAAPTRRISGLSDEVLVPTTTSPKSVRIFMVASTPPCTAAADLSILSRALRHELPLLQLGCEGVELMNTHVREAPCAERG